MNFTIEGLFMLIKQADEVIQELADPTTGDYYQFGIFLDAGSYNVGWQIPLDRNGDTDWFKNHFEYDDDIKSALRKICQWGIKEGYITIE